MVPKLALTLLLPRPKDPITATAELIYRQPLRSPASVTLLPEIEMPEIEKPEIEMKMK